MIENIYKGKKLLTCDNCGEGQEFDSWEDALEHMGRGCTTVRNVRKG